MQSRCRWALRNDGGNSISNTATAGARLSLQRVIRAAVVAIQRAVVVAVDIGGTATAYAWRRLRSIVRALVVAVRCAIAVGIRIGHAAAAGARLRL